MHDMSICNPVTWQGVFNTMAFYCPTGRSLTIYLSSFTQKRHMPYTESTTFRLFELDTIGICQMSVLLMFVLLFSTAVNHIPVICSWASRQMNAMNRVSEFLSKDCKIRICNAFPQFGIFTPGKYPKENIANSFKRLSGIIWRFTECN